MFRYFALYVGLTLGFAAPVFAGVVTDGTAPSFACSATDVGSVTINELNSANNNTSFDYVELKVIVDGTNIDGWQLCASSSSDDGCWNMTDGTWYSDGGTSSGAIPSSDAVFNNDTWLVFDAASASVGSLPQIKADQGEVLLLDGPEGSSGSKVVDYLVYSNNANNCKKAETWTIDASCGVSFCDKNPNEKNLAREPDGTGDWGNNGNDATLGDTNDSGGGSGPTVAYYGVTHSGTGITCAASSITITARDGAGAPVHPGNITVDLSTSTGRGQWSLPAGQSGTLTDNTNFDGVASYTFPDDGVSSSVTLDFNYPELVADPERVNFNVSGGAATDPDDNDNSQDLDLEVSLAGFLFSNVPTQVSGKDSDRGWNGSSLSLQAVKALETNTAVCTALFGGSVTIEIGAECVNPSNCNLAVMIGADDGDLLTSADPSSPIATNDDNADLLTSAYTFQTLNFDSDAIAHFAINYPDAGRMQLHAKYQLLDENGIQSGQYVSGSSDTFVVRPFALAFRNIDDGGVPLIANGEGEAPDGERFISAGSRFQFNLGAYRYADGEDISGATIANADGSFGDGVADDDADVTDNGAVPNFNADVLWSIGSITPVSGANGSLNVSGAIFSVTSMPTSVAGLSFVSGNELEDIAASYNEYGSVTIVASIQDYLSASNADVSVTSPTIGRFYPEVLVLSADSVIGSCDNMTYMDEPALDISYELEARGADGVTKLLHYDEDLVGGPASLAAISINLINKGDSVDVSRLGDLTSKWVEGIYGYDNPTSSFDRGVVPDGPIDSLQILLSASDPLGDNFTISGAAGSPASVAVGSATSIRYGRVAVDNVFGPETEDLSVFAEVQYFNGSAFETNDADRCSPLAVHIISPSNLRVASGGTVSVGDDGVSTVTYEDISLDGGKLNLTFGAPNPIDTGDIRFQISDLNDPISPGLGALNWLKFDWNNDGDYGDDPGPRTATFGRYRGNDRILFWQENFSR